jgi:hypothetical protein
VRAVHIGGPAVTRSGAGHGGRAKKKGNLHSGVLRPWGNQARSAQQEQEGG